MQSSSDLLQVRALSFAYGKRRLWENVNFDVPVGAVTGILGNNGTGKSTLLNCIGGILQPDAGNVFFKGVDLLKLSRRKRARHVAYVSQHFETSGASVYDTVLLGRLPYFYAGPTREDHEAVERVLHEFGIEQWVNRNAKTLSGGEAQKVMLARAVVQQTNVLLLDEPKASLDLGSQVDMLAFVSQYAQRHNVVVLMVSHDINAALRFRSQFVLIDPKGNVSTVAAQDLTEAHLRRTYGVDVRLHEIDGQRFAFVEGKAHHFQRRVGNV